MRLTEEQFKALTPYRKHFLTMINAGWCRIPGGKAEIDLMHSIYVKVTGDNSRFNSWCDSCIKRLVKELGRIYLQDEEEINNKSINL